MSVRLKIPLRIIPQLSSPVANIFKISEALLHPFKKQISEKTNIWVFNIKGKILYCPER